MQLIQKIAELVVFSNIWIALAASSLTVNTYLVTQQKTNWIVVAIVFCSTFSIYNLQRIIKHFFQKRNYSLRHQWINKHINILTVLVFFSTVLAVLLFFSRFTIHSFIYFIPFTFVSVFYTFAILPNNKGLRDIPFIKIFLIGITWAVSTTLLPYLDIDKTSVSLFKIISLLLYNFFFVIAITIPFDIRDIDVDTPHTKTIPQYFGVKKAIFIASFLLLLCLFIAGLSLFNLGNVIAPLIALLVIQKAKTKREELFYSGVLDGLLFVPVAINFLNLF